MPAVFLGIAGAIIFVVYMLHDNTYLQYAPDYKKTIYHTDLTSTWRPPPPLEDVSSAERIYRWIAGVKMIEDKALHRVWACSSNQLPGYAVNTVHYLYQPERRKKAPSTIYLMVTVEQGFPGLLFWMILLVAILYYGQKLHPVRSST